MKVSVITVSYNSRKTIEKTINSVFNQTYNNVEHIIVDGKSDDGTINIIKENIHKISKFIYEKDNGLYDAMNKGIKVSKGEIICILNSDDMFYDREVLMEIVKEFKSNNLIDVIFSNIKFYKNCNSKSYISRIVKAPYLSKNKFRFGWVPPHPGMFVRKRVYNILGLYDRNYKNAADYDFFIRIFLSNIFNILYLNKFTVLMLEGGKSNKNFLSLIVNTKEIITACLNNGIYTNFILLIFRLPMKYVQNFFIKFSEKKNV